MASALGFLESAVFTNLEIDSASVARHLLSCSCSPQLGVDPVTKGLAAAYIGNEIGGRSSQGGAEVMGELCGEVMPG